MKKLLQWNTKFYMIILMENNFDANGKINFNARIKWWCMHEWMNNANVNTMNGQNKIRSMNDIIEFSEHEMNQHNT